MKIDLDFNTDTDDKKVTDAYSMDIEVKKGIKKLAVKKGIKKSKLVNRILKQVLKSEGIL